VAGIERDSLLGVHRALFPTNVPLDYVHIDHLGEGRLHQYRLVILPYPPMLPQASAAAIREYVRQGGTLVAEARLGWNDERGYASDRVPGLGLSEVVGARELAIETAPNGRTAIQWRSGDVPGLKAGDRLPARWYKETLEPTSPQSRVVGRFADGTPAAIMSSYGQGRTLMLGSYVSAAYQSTPTPEVERFYTGLLSWAGVTLPITVAGAPLEARYLESGADALLFLFNHGSERAVADVALRRRAGRYAAVDLVSGQPVESTQTSDGLVTVKAEIAPADVRVLRVGVRP
jgi:beta-galactosidase